MNAEEIELSGQLEDIMKDTSTIQQRLDDLRDVVADMQSQIEYLKLRADRKDARFKK